MYIYIYIFIYIYIYTYVILFFTAPIPSSTILLRNWFLRWRLLKPQKHWLPNCKWQISMNFEDNLGSPSSRNCHVEGVQILILLQSLVVGCTYSASVWIPCAPKPPCCSFTYTAKHHGLEKRQKAFQSKHKIGLHNLDYIQYSTP